MEHTHEAHCDFEQSCIKVGPWGCPGASQWCYKAKGGGIKQIVIHHGRAIGFILFRSDDIKGAVDYASRFGGNGLGNEGRTDKIDIDWPREYLTSLGGSFNFICPSGPMVIKSLCFYTNLTMYGPYGSETGNFFSFPMEGGAIVGFHGRSGDFVDSIGVYVKPMASFCSSTQESVNQEITENRIVKAVEPQEPGPWGGRGGKPWDDGVFSAIKQVHVHVENGIVRAIQLEYEKRDGESVSSERHGGPCNSGKVYRIKLDSASEFLVGIAGFYGKIDGNDGLEAVCSITLYTNIGKYGPFGDEIGTSFTSTVSSGKVVGFHGRSGANLDAVGVYMEYF